MKTISISLAIIFVFSLSAGAANGFFSAKTIGKLSMAAILSVTAFVIKILVNKDRNEANKLHQRLGEPDRSAEFQEGFHRWRMEWYGDSVYVFRDGVLHGK